MEFEAAVHVNKSRIKTVYIIGGILFLAAVGGIIWSTLYWDQYSETVRNVLTGRVRQRGLAPTVNGWSWMFAVAVPLIYGIMWFSIDFKNPAYAVNKDGIWLNTNMFKKTFVTWNEIGSVERSGNELNIRVKNAQSIIDRQKGMSKAFLKTTHVTQNQPIKVQAAGITGDLNQVNTLAENYFRASRTA